LVSSYLSIGLNTIFLVDIFSCDTSSYRLSFIR